MKEIHLKNNLITLVSDEDYDLVKNYNWRINRNCVYATIDGKMIRIHHHILGKPKYGLIIDHINKDFLDNRRENLRFITLSHSNQKTRKTKKTQYIGIYYNEKKKSWRVYCKKHYLGCFSNELEAAKHYDKAAFVFVIQILINGFKR